MKFALPDPIEPAGDQRVRRRVLLAHELRTCEPRTRPLASCPRNQARRWDASPLGSASASDTTGWGRGWTKTNDSPSKRTKLSNITRRRQDA